MKPVKLNFKRAGKLITCHLVKLENDNEFLIEYNVNDTDFVMSFFIEDNTITNRHIENIDSLTIDGIYDAHAYLTLIERELIEFCKENF